MIAGRALKQAVRMVAGKTEEKSVNNDRRKGGLDSGRKNCTSGSDDDGYRTGNYNRVRENLRQGGHNTGAG